MHSQGLFQSRELNLLFFIYFDEALSSHFFLFIFLRWLFTFTTVTKVKLYGVMKLSVSKVSFDISYARMIFILLYYPLYYALFLSVILHSVVIYLCLIPLNFSTIFT